MRQALPGAEIGEAHTFEECQSALDRRPDTDLLLMDINMPGMQGFSGLLYVRAQYPQVPVAIVSAIEDAPVIHAVYNYGAQGYIPKSLPIDDIGAAIKTVLNGDTYVPPIPLDGEGSDETAELVRKLSTLTSAGTCPDVSV